MPEVPADQTDDAEASGDDAGAEEPRPVVDEYFEDERHVSAADAGEFLVALGEGLQSGEELTVSSEDWELPFAFGEPVELEVEYEGGDEPELEIEVELPGRTEADEPPEVT